MTSENHLTFRAGQDVTIPNIYDYQGIGFSKLDLQWAFTVEGTGGALRQDLLSGSGRVHANLFDITASSLSSDLLVNCSGCSTYNLGGIHDGNIVNLLDGHSYLLTASLINESSSDGWEAEFFVTADNATINLPEPEMPLILSSGLIGLFLIRKWSVPFKMMAS